MAIGFSRYNFASTTLNVQVYLSEWLVFGCGHERQTEENCNLTMYMLVGKVMPKAEPDSHFYWKFLNRNRRKEQKIDILVIGIGSRVAMISVPLRTRLLLEEAEELEKEQHYASVILLYSHYLEQRLLIHHLNDIEDSNPSTIKLELDNLIRMKDERKLVFGKILNIVSSSINDSEVMNICREVKKVRDTIAAHFFFVAPLDKNNRTKRAFYDVNNYRKIVRRLYALVREHQRLPQIEYFLNLGSPLTKISTIEEEEIAIERELLKVICDQTRRNVKRALSLLRRKPPGALTQYMNSS